MILRVSESENSRGEAPKTPITVMVFVAPSLPPILNIKGEKWCYFNKKTFPNYFPKTFPNMKWSSF